MIEGAGGKDGSPNDCNGREMLPVHCLVPGHYWEKHTPAFQILNVGGFLPTPPNAGADAGHIDSVTAVLAVGGDFAKLLLLP